MLEGGDYGTQLTQVPSISIAAPAPAHFARQHSDDAVPPTGDRRASDAYQGHRRKVADALNAFGSYFSNTPHETFDDSEFREGNARQYPQVPGELERNDQLLRIMRNWDADNDGTRSMREQRSRAASVSRDPSSGLGAEGGLSTRRIRPVLPLQSQNHLSPQAPDLQSAATSSRLVSTGDTQQSRRGTV